MRYLMTPIEKRLEDVGTCNAQLVASVSGNEVSSEIEWFKRLQSDILGQIHDAHAHLMDRRDEPPQKFSLSPDPLEMLPMPVHGWRHESQRKRRKSTWRVYRKERKLNCNQKRKEVD